MALVDHDSWEIEYEGCERLRFHLLMQLNQRQQLSDPSSDKYVELDSSLRSGLEQLKKDVEHLKVVLDAAIADQTSSPRELERRRSVFEQLRRQVDEVSADINIDRQTAMPRSVWQDADTPAVINIPTNVEELKQHKMAVLESQNRGLDVLSATLSRQRQQASQLGNEVEYQNHILDNLSNTMDRVENGVQRETRNISQVSRRDSTCGYWVVIVALFVGIVVVVFL